MTGWAATNTLRSAGGCGAISSDGALACILPIDHEGAHGWEERASAPPDDALDLIAAALRQDENVRGGNAGPLAALATVRDELQRLREERDAALDRESGTSDAFQDANASASGYRADRDEWRDRAEAAEAALRHRRTRMSGCLVCGSSEHLTKHHLLPDHSRRRMGEGRGGRWVKLCWSCHLPLHRGGKQEEAWARLWPLLTDADREYVTKNREPGTMFADRISAVIEVYAAMRRALAAADGTPKDTA